MAPINPQRVRGKDGAERVLLDLSEFQALVDAASAAEHGLPNVATVVRELKVALSATEGYLDAEELLQQYDAAHDAG